MKKTKISMKNVDTSIKNYKDVSGAGYYNIFCDEFVINPNVNKLVIIADITKKGVDVHKQYQALKKSSDTCYVAVASSNNIKYLFKKGYTLVYDSVKNEIIRKYER